MTRFTENYAGWLCGICRENTNYRLYNHPHPFPVPRNGGTTFIPTKNYYRKNLNKIITISEVNDV